MPRLLNVFAHGVATAAAVSLRLDGAGHGIDAADRETIAAAIIDHAAAADPAG